MSRTSHEIEIAWRPAPVKGGKDKDKTSSDPARIVASVSCDGIEDGVHMVMNLYRELELSIADSELVEVRLTRAAA